MYDYTKRPRLYTSFYQQFLHARNMEALSHYIIITPPLDTHTTRADTCNLAQLRNTITTRTHAHKTGIALSIHRHKHITATSLPPVANIVQMIPVSGLCGQIHPGQFDDGCAKKLVLLDPVVVPRRHLQHPATHNGQRKVVHQQLHEAGVTVLKDHFRLLLGRLVPVWQKVRLDVRVGRRLALARKVLGVHHHDGQAAGLVDDGQLDATHNPLRQVDTLAKLAQVVGERLVLRHPFLVSQERVEEGVDETAV